MAWVTERKLLAEIGWTKNQLKGKVQRGVLIKGVHWAVIDGPRMFNVEAIQEWLNTQACAQRPEALRSDIPMPPASGAASGPRRRRRTPTSRMQLDIDAA